jgi:hypothetical protein
VFHEGAEALLVMSAARHVPRAATQGVSGFGSSGEAEFEGPPRCGHELGHHADRGAAAIE